MSDTLLKLNNLTKTYSGVNVVDNVNLEIKKGSIYGLIGKNGAGKTTLMKLITGLIFPASGSFAYSGLSSSKSKVFGKIGALIETPAFYPKLSAYDNLKIKAIAYGKNDANYLMDKLRFVGLEKVGKKKVGKFSLGMKQRLALAMTLIGEPELLVLDEPINALDPQGIVEVREMILKLNKEQGITIIISSHILEELSKIVTDYAIIDKGKIVEASTLKTLKEKSTDGITFKVNDVEKAANVIKEMGIKNFKVVDNETLEIYEKIEKRAEINKKLVLSDVDVFSIFTCQKSMEKYFVELVGDKKEEQK